MATFRYERLPVSIAADAGTSISLKALFDSAFGAGWFFPGGFSVFAGSTAAQSRIAENGSTSHFGFWDPANKQDSYYKIAGNAVSLGTSIYKNDGFESVEIIAGNALTPLLMVAVQNSLPGSVDPIYTWYSITVFPKDMAAPAGQPITGAAIAAKGLEYAARYGTVPLLWDCGWIVESITAAVGAALPARSESINPAENQEGGLWRIVHRGDLNPVDDWQALVQPGDMVRMKWKGAGFHTTLVISGQDGDGNMVVVDNGGKNGETVVHKAKYDEVSRPESITIYRLSPDGLYLLEGTSGNERLNGSTGADDLRGGAGNDLLMGGIGDDKIIGGAGDDTIDGGAGTDTVWLNAIRSGVKFSFTADGKTVLTSTEGRDVLTNMEKVHFSDGQVIDLSALAPPSPTVSILPAAALTQFVTSSNPTSSELDNRAAAAAAAYDYYKDVLKVANPQLGPYESLGVSFSSLAAFQSKYGSGTDAAFVTKAYQDVFQRAPTASQQQAFVGQIDYFIGLYQKSGLSASTADAQARGAVLGQMLGYVMTDPTESGRVGQTIDDRAAAFVSSLPTVSLVGASVETPVI